MRTSRGQDPLATFHTPDNLPGEGSSELVSLSNGPTGSEEGRLPRKREDVDHRRKGASRQVNRPDAMENGTMGDGRWAWWSTPSLPRPPPPKINTDQEGISGSGGLSTLSPPAWRGQRESPTSREGLVRAKSGEDPHRRRLSGLKRMCKAIGSPKQFILKVIKGNN